MLGAAVEPVVSWPETQSQRPKGERHENAERGRGGGVVDGAGLRADPQHQPDAGTQSKSPEEKEQDAIRDKAYKDSLRKIPDAKASSDPWGTVRSTDAPKDAAAPAKKSKTGSTSQ